MCLVLWPMPLRTDQPAPEEVAGYVRVPVYVEMDADPLSETRIISISATPTAGCSLACQTCPSATALPPGAFARRYARSLALEVSSESLFRVPPLLTLAQGSCCGDCMSGCCCLVRSAKEARREARSSDQMSSTAMCIGANGHGNRKTCLDARRAR